MIRYNLILAALVFFALMISSGCRNRAENKKQTEIPVSARTNVSEPSSGLSIHEAALNGMATRVMSLLESKMNVNALDQDGRSALMYAAFNGHVGVMKMLIDAGASVNFRDSYGRTALMMASSGPDRKSVV